MDNWKSIIISSIISPAIFEILKYFSVFIINKIKEKSLPYTMDGYWYASVKESEYIGYELIKIKQRNNKLYFHIYQLTNDDRFYVYKGCGYIRDSKVSLSYEEAKENKSSVTGNITLLKRDITQHTPKFEGIYSHFFKEETICTTKPYNLFSLKINKMDRLLLLMFKSMYAKKYMKKERFISGCENAV